MGKKYTFFIVKHLERIKNTNKTEHFEYSYITDILFEYAFIFILFM
jgi:hypothetical protein